MASSSKSRQPVGSFCEAKGHNVYFARGDMPVKRWDGLLSDYVNAGLPAPSESLGLKEELSDETNLMGTYYAYQRWLDDRGNVSNVSPLVGPLPLLGGNYRAIDDVTSKVTTTEGSIAGRKGIRRIRYAQITSTNHGLKTYADGGARSHQMHFEGLPMDGLPQFGIFGNGEWTVVVLDENRLRVKVNNTFDIGGDPFVDYRSPAVPWLYTGGGVWKTTGTTVQYSNFLIPTDSRVSKRQILRNKDGNVNTFYVDIEQTRDEWESDVENGFHTDSDDLNPGTVYVSAKLDSALGEEVPLRASDGTDLNINRHSEPPNFKSVIVGHANRIFAGVNLNYKRGSANVAFGAKTVTGNGTSWTEAMAGRKFITSNSTFQYGIESVDVDAQELTLSSEYEQDTNLTESYCITPGDDEHLSIHFSEALLPESWDRKKVLHLTEDPLSGKMTSLFALGPRLFIGFENRIYSLNYMTDPSVDGQVSLSVARGCINQRCVVQDGTQAFILDKRGVYAFNGGGVQEVSQNIQAVFSSEYNFGINWTHSEHFHASHDSSKKTVRWFVSMGGAIYPRHALTFSYKTKRWWIEEYPEPISSTASGEIDNGHTTLWGGSHGRVMATSRRPTDGMSSAVSGYRGRVSSSTPTRLIDGSKTFIQSYIGAPVHISEGTGEGQTRIIVSLGDNYLEVDRPFVILPDSTSYYQIGGFRWKYSTPVLTMESPPSKKAMRSTETRFKPTSDPSTLLIKKYTDFNDSPDTLEYQRSSDEGDGAKTEEGGIATCLDTTHSTGSVQQSFDGVDTPRSNRGKSLTFRFEGVPNGESHQIFSVMVEGGAGQ